MKYDLLSSAIPLNLSSRNVRQCSGASPSTHPTWVISTCPRHLYAMMMLGQASPTPRPLEAIVSPPSPFSSLLYLKGKMAKVKLFCFHFLKPEPSIRSILISSNTIVVTMLITSPSPAPSRPVRDHIQWTLPPK